MLLRVVADLKTEVINLDQRWSCPKGSQNKTLGVKRSHQIVVNQCHTWTLKVTKIGLY